MKKINPKYLTIAIYAIAVIAFSILFLLLGLNLRTFFSFLGNIIDKLGSIFYGVLFALILLPFVKWFERHYAKLFCKKKHRSVLLSVLSLVTVYILLFALLFAAIWFIIPAIVDNFTELYERTLAFLGAVDGDFSAPVEKLSALLTNLFESSSPILTELMASLEKYLEENVLNLQNASSIVAAVVAVIGVLISQLSDIFLGLIISVYLLASRRVISGICGKLVVSVFSEKSAVKFVIFFKRLYTDFCDFAACRVFLSFFVCAGVFVLSWVGGIPMFSIIVIILFVTQLIPTLGTLIGVLASSAIVLILSPVHAIFFIPALITLEILTSYLVMPLFLQKKLRPAHGATAVLVLIGYALFGPIGAFLAVPIYATLSIEVRSFMAHRLAKKKMPISTEAYEKNDIGTLLKESREAQEAAEAAAEAAEAACEDTPSQEEGSVK